MTFTVVFCIILSLASFIISFFQFKEKGFVFNNAYLYASKKEREEMNRKPYYRQSAIIFFIIGIIFALITVKMFVNTVVLKYVLIALTAFILIYTIVSAIYIETRKK